MESRDWLFVPQDIGVALLGWLIAGVGSGVLALGAEWGVAPVIFGGLLSFISLWHLGWRLAFPNRLGMGDTATIALMVAGPVGLIAILSLAAVVGLD